MLPVVLVTSVSPELAAAAFERLLSRSGTVGISYADSPLRRVIHTSSEVVELRDVEPESDCAACAIASDALAATTLLADLDRWAGLVICLPTAMAADGLVARLDSTDAETGATYVRSVLVVVDAATVRDDLGGDALLDERGLASSDCDRRSVAEAIVAQVEYADTLLLSGIEDARVPEPETQLVQELLARLNPGARSTTCSELPDVAAPSRSPRSRAAFDVAAARARVEPGVISAPLRDTAYGVTTVVWRAVRPMHPGRLRAALTDLVDGVARSRGRLWLANRPTQMLAWESAGGSASLGVLGSWLADTATQDWGQLPTALRASAALDWDDLVGDRCCELSLTGTLPDPGRLRERLESCLLDDVEYGAGPASWTDIADPFVDALGLAAVLLPYGVPAQEWR